MEIGVYLILLEILLENGYLIFCLISTRFLQITSDLS